jgi:hypothetical protein
VRTIPAHSQYIVCYHSIFCLLGILCSIALSGSRPDRVLLIVNQFLGKEGIEILLLLLSVCALAIRIPSVNNAHSQHSYIDLHQPVKGSQLFS